MAKIKLLFLLLILASFSILAQQIVDSSKVDKDFINALKLYNSGNFKEAQMQFNDIIAKNEFNGRTTIAYLFNAKSFVQLKQYGAAQQVLQKFLSEYPESKYVNEAKLTLAQIFYDQGNYLPAFVELCNLVNTTSSPEYDHLAKSNAEKIALNFLSASQVDSVYDSTTVTKSKPFLLLELGKIYMQNSNKENALNSFSEIIKQYKNSEERSDAATLYEKVSAEILGPPSNPVIAVLLPLKDSSNNKISKTVSEILEGIKYAASEYNKNHKEKIGLLIKNTARNKSQIEKIKNEIADVHSVKAIIGPVYSDEVKETLEIFKNSGIPIISPTATDDSLTDLYPDFFQANPSFSERGAIMAEYIYYVENKKVMAVLNSNNGYSPALADAFIKKFTSLGGQILIRQTYSAADPTFDRQIANIAADSLRLNGIYIPLSGNLDVTLLLSTFVKYDFNLPLYGNQDWLNAKGFETYPALSNKLTFTSDYYLDYTDSTFEDFEKRFLNLTNIIVNRNVLYGYDAAEYLFKSVKNFNVDTKAIRNYLIAKTVYQGFHNNIYFDKSRINKFLNIVRYKDGTFQIVDKFKLSN